MISCLMPTYGRYVNLKNNKTQVVEEAIESFLRQDYDGEAELIVLNDQESVTYHLEAPGVRIINQPERFKTLGDKRNRLVELAKGEICVLWDDDDISLPRRLSNVHKFFDANPKVTYAGASMVAFSVNNSNYKLEYIQGPGRYAAGAFRTTAGLAVGYRSTSSGEDAAFCADLASNGYTVTNYDMGTTDFIYRWGLGIWHISPNSEVDYDRMGEQDFQQAEVYLRPHWLYDYAAKVRELESRED